MRLRLAFLIGLFFAVAAAERVGAQGFHGGLRGSVRDPNGTLTNGQTLRREFAPVVTRHALIMTRRPFSWISQALA